jgi:hypothetical protein
MHTTLIFGLNYVIQEERASAGVASFTDMCCKGIAEAKQIFNKNTILYVLFQPVLRIRIRDPVPFYPKDPGSGMIFFSGSRIRISDPYHVPNSRFYLQKWRKTGKIIYLLFKI